MIRFLAGFVFCLWCLYAGALVFLAGMITGGALLLLVQRLRRPRPSLAATLPEREIRRMIAAL